MKKYNLLFLTLLLFVYSCTEKTDSDLSGYVYGTITSINSNTPVAGVVVQCNGFTYTTGANGYFSIENLPIGNNQLTASKTDFETYSKTINVKSSGTEENISLVSNIVGASVWGYIKHTSGTPISGASVTIAGMSDNTDATGRYQLPSIPQGNQDISVQASGYEEYNQSFYMYSSDKQININLRKFNDSEFAIDKDNYWSNFSGTGNSNSEELFTGEYMGKNNYLFFHSNINIPDNSEVTSMNIQFYINDTDYKYNWDWGINTITKNWDEANVTNNNVSVNYALNAPYESKSGYYILINILDAYKNYKNDFSQYGFVMWTKDDKDYNWTVTIPSSENSITNRRPIIKVSYLY